MTYDDTWIAFKRMHFLFHSHLAVSRTRLTKETLRSPGYVRFFNIS